MLLLQIRGRLIHQSIFCRLTLTRRRSLIKRITNNNRIIYSMRRTRVFLALRTDRRIRCTRTGQSIRHKSQFINSRSTELKNRNTNSNRALTLATKRLTKRPKNRVLTKNRACAIRRFSSAFICFHITRAKVVSLRQADGIIFSHVR